MSKESNSAEPHTELEFIAQNIAKATVPEDIFGTLENNEDKYKAGRSLYYQLSRRVHPNVYLDPSEQTLATEASKKLNQLWEVAEERLRNGTYGNVGLGKTATEPIIIKSRKHEYTLTDQIGLGEITNIYLCQIRSSSDVDQIGYIKIARETIDSDLVENEARILRQLKESEDFDKFQKYYPNLLESFSFIDPNDPRPRQLNSFILEDQLYSLQEVKNHHKAGINPKDMAWIWRRVLVGLGFAHHNQVINGAVLPPFIFVQPEKHGLVFIDWSYAVADPDNSGERISVISTEYESWYPQEVFQKDLPTPGLDIFMGAQCMVYLLGGDPLTGELPSSINKQIRTFFQGCLLPHPRQRPQDAWGLLEEFNQLIDSIWGPRRFHPFSMPKSAQSLAFRTERR